MNLLTRLALLLALVAGLGGLAGYLINFLPPAAPPAPATATTTIRRPASPTPLPTLMIWFVSDDEKDLLGVWQAIYTPGLEENALKMLWRGVPAHHPLDATTTLGQSFHTLPSLFPEARYDYFKDQVYNLITPRPEKVLHIVLTPTELARWAGRLGGLMVNERLTLTEANFGDFARLMLAQTPAMQMDLQSALIQATCVAVASAPPQVHTSTLATWLQAETINLSDSTPFDEWTRLALEPPETLANLQCEIQALPAE